MQQVKDIAENSCGHQQQVEAIKTRFFPVQARPPYNQFQQDFQLHKPRLKLTVAVHRKRNSQ